MLFHVTECSRLQALWELIFINQNHLGNQRVHNTSDASEIRRNSPTAALMAFGKATRSARLYWGLIFWSLECTMYHVYVFEISYVPEMINMRMVADDIALSSTWTHAHGWMYVWRTIALWINCASATNNLQPRRNSSKSSYSTTIYFHVVLQQPKPQPFYH